MARSPSPVKDDLLLPAAEQISPPATYMEGQEVSSEPFVNEVASQESKFLSFIPFTSPRVSKVLVLVSLVLVLLTLFSLINSWLLTSELHQWRARVSVLEDKLSLMTQLNKALQDETSKEAIGHHVDELWRLYRLKDDLLHKFEIWESEVALLRQRLNSLE